MGNYVETRYFTDGNTNLEYIDLVRKTTQYSIASDSGDTNSAYIDTGIYNYFSLTHFNRLGTAVGGVTKSITIDLSVEMLEEAVSTNNPDLSAYLGDLDTLSSSNDYIIDKGVIAIAKTITNYYIASSALYAFIYSSQSELNLTETGVFASTGATSYTINSSDILGGGYTGPNIILTNVEDGSKIIEKLHSYYIKSVGDLKLSDTTYNSHLTNNIHLNKTFLEQNEKLGQKEEIFDTKKAFAITMMAKSHKANKLYSAKQFWFLVYLALFVIYVFGIFGMISASHSSLDIFKSFKSTILGSVIVSINVVILLSLCLFDIIKYFNK